MVPGCRAAPAVLVAPGAGQGVSTEGRAPLPPVPLHVTCSGHIAFSVYCCCGRATGTAPGGVNK
eukprot:12769367-Alexandrium_andersonii.AAC.1